MTIQSKLWSVPWLCQNISMFQHSSDVRMVLTSISLNEAPIFRSSSAELIRSAASFGVKLC